MKEAYCSYEIAKLLKEKGFDEPTLTFYIPFEDGEVKFNIDSNEIHYNTLDEYPWIIAAPTHQMACAWIRERGYHISILYQRKWQTWGRIIQELSTGIEWSLGGFDSHERVVEAALKYALENLI